MKHTRITALFAALALASTPLFAQEGGGRRGTPLGSEMKKLDKAVEAVADFLKKPEGDAPVAEVAAAQEALHKAKQETPRLLQRQPEGEQASFLAAYKTEINKAIRSMLDLEDALLKKDWQAAAAALEAIQQAEKAGHRQFKPQRGNRGGGGGGERGGRTGG